VTAVLRHSALHFLDYGVPLADGTVGDGDRQTLAGRYAGILAATPATAAATSGRVATYRERTATTWLELTVTTWRERTAVTYQED